MFKLLRNFVLGLFMLILVIITQGCSYLQPEYKIITKYETIKVDVCSVQIPSDLLTPFPSPEVPIITSFEKDEQIINAYIYDLYFSNRYNQSKIKQISDIYSSSKK